MTSTFDRSVIELNQAEMNTIVGGGAAKATGTAKGGVFEVEDYSFDIEQVLNIGSQSSGAGAGKVTFNPF